MMIRIPILNLACALVLGEVGTDGVGKLEEYGYDDHFEADDEALESDGEVVEGEVVVGVDVAAGF